MILSVISLLRVIQSTFLTHLILQRFHILVLTAEWLLLRMPAFIGIYSLVSALVAAAEGVSSGHGGTAAAYSCCPVEKWVQASVCLIEQGVVG